MFTLSKLLMGGGAIASSGGLASYLIPYYFDTGDVYIFGENSLDSMDLYPLKEAINSVKKELEEWISKFNQSKNVSQKSKNREFENSLKLMDKIQANEEQLKKLYEVIKEKLTTLGEQSQKWSQEVENKLKLQSNLSQFKNVLNSLNSLISTLNSWENNMSKVIEVFKENELQSVTTSSSGGAMSKKQQGKKLKRF